MKKLSLDKALPIVWLMVILILSSQAGLTSGMLSRDIARHIQTLFGLNMSIETINFVLRKFAHVFVFGVEGALVYNAIKKPIPASTICTAIAIIDEGHKVFISGRHCHFNEMVLDIVSSLVIIIILDGKNRI